MTEAEDAAERIDAFRRELEAHLGRMTDELAADTVTLLLYDAETDQFDLPVQHGLDDPDTFTDRALVPGTDRLAGKIVHERRAIFAERISGHPEMDGPFAKRERLASAAALPLVENGRPLGVLFASYRSPHLFPSEERHRIERSTRKVVQAIGGRNDLFPSLRRLRPGPQSETDRTLHWIVKLACSLIEGPAAIWLPLHLYGDRLVIRAAAGLTHTYVDGAIATRGDGSVIDEVLKTGRAAELTSLETDGRFSYVEEARRAAWKSMLALPIRYREQNHGVLQVFKLDQAPFKHPDEENLRRLAKVAGAAIESTYRADEAEKLAELAATLSAKPDPESVMREIVESARDLTGADSSAVVLLDKRTNTFVVGSRVPAEGPPQVDPRREHGLTAHIIDTGKSVLIRDTEDDDRVNPGVRDQGIRSLIGVRLEFQEERFGVLYVDGRRPDQFTHEDLRLLESVADRASVALGWTRLLVDPWAEIEQATSHLFLLDNILESVCQEIQDALGFDFVAVQLVRRDLQTIEAVYGIGLAAKWAGRSRHYLHNDPELRDIQADIAMAHPLRTEILRGWDPRFDEGLFSEFHHREFVRVFSPLLILRTRSGHLVDDWVKSCELRVSRKQVWRRESEASGRRTVIEMSLDSKYNQLEKDVIGTIEAGYRDPRRRIELKKARKLIELVAGRVRTIRSGMLRHVQETIIEQARRIVGADSASLHFPWDPESQQYRYQVRMGVPTDFLERYPPSPQGLGRAAVKHRQAKLIPDPAQGQGELELKRVRPDLFAAGIRAMAAFPLIVGDQDGVLYLHYHQPHRFRKDEIGWVQLLANRAEDAIRHSTAYMKIRDRARQLATLQSVVQFLVSNLEETDLLRKISWSTLNTLAADVVTIYEYNEGERSFRTPPAIAGRLRNKPEMRSEVHSEDAPALLVEHGENVFVAGPVKGDPILNRPGRIRAGRKAADFVARESIESSAGLLLKVADEIVGLLFINYRRRHRFTADDRRIIEALASAAAIAIKNKRLLERGQQDLMTITHHLQGPLIAVSSVLKNLLSLSQANDALPPTQGPVPVPKYFRERLERAHALNEDVVEASDGILTSFAREAGRSIVLRKNAIDAPEEIRRLCERMRLTNSRPDLGFRYRTTSQFPILLFDRRTFITVMYNLIHNALKYSAKKSTVYVSCKHEEGGKFVHIRVKSTGEIIEEGEKEKIFGKFQQAVVIQKTGRHHAGVGLGLWAARASMRAAGGDLRLLLSKSRPDDSTFVVDVPVIEDQ